MVPLARLLVASCAVVRAIPLPFLSAGATGGAHACGLGTRTEVVLDLPSNQPPILDLGQGWARSGRGRQCQAAEKANPYAGSHRPVASVGVLAPGWRLLPHKRMMASPARRACRAYPLHLPEHNLGESNGAEMADRTLEVVVYSWSIREFTRHSVVSSGSFARRPPRARKHASAGLSRKAHTGFEPVPPP